MNALRYADPRALRQAVTDRLKSVARDRPEARLADLQRQLAYDRLLCRVFMDDPHQWVIKGATAMLARLQGVARHTLDIDLYRTHGDLAGAEAGLRQAAAIDLGDHFRFALSPGRLIAQEARTLRVAVVAYVGVTDFAAFRVDLSTALSMTSMPDEVPPLIPIDLPGVPQTRYLAYPVADHIADKVCAMCELHRRAGEPPEPSTRYRDLVDLVVFAHRVTVSADALTTAMRSEFERRRMAWPGCLAVPDDAGWRAGYARAARDAPALAERDMDSALAVATRLVDPVLAGDATGSWDPERMAWRR